MTLVLTEIIIRISFTGFSQVRLAQNGNWLPSPRLIHTVLFPETDVFDFKHTLAVMEWGQIVAHDITFLSVKKGVSYLFGI